jgi:hypothetical protein
MDTRYHNLAQLLRDTRRNGPDWGFPGSDAQAGTQWMQAFYQFVSDF